jgi:hypothetical protein
LHSGSADLHLPDLNPSHIVPGLWLDLCWDAAARFLNEEAGSINIRRLVVSQVMNSGSSAWRLKWVEKNHSQPRVTYSEYVNSFDSHDSFVIG